MSSDLIGRRRASEQRLDRARSLELSLKEKTDILVETTGMPIEQLDFDGSFRAALTALASVASRRTTFDVIITLPDAPFAMRIQHVNNVVSAEVLIQRDGPFEPVSGALPEPPYSGHLDPLQLDPLQVYHQQPDPLPLYPARSEPEPLQLEPRVAAASAPPDDGSTGPDDGSTGLVHVASDLAALLWQDVDDMPS
jgi:hypothetical protein